MQVGANKDPGKKDQGNDILRVPWCDMCTMDSQDSFPRFRAAADGDTECAGQLYWVDGQSYPPLGVASLQLRGRGRRLLVNFRYLGRPPFNSQVIASLQ